MEGSVIFSGKNDRKDEKSELLRQCGTVADQEQSMKCKSSIGQ